MIITEDVLRSRVSHYWSKDSRYICYAELNDTGVPLMAWQRYGNTSDVYGETIQIAYPKVSCYRYCLIIITIMSLIMSLRKLTYDDRLHRLKLWTLEERRNRVD